MRIKLFPHEFETPIPRKILHHKFLYYDKTYGQVCPSCVSFKHFLLFSVRKIICYRAEAERNYWNNEQLYAGNEMKNPIGTMYNLQQEI